MRCLLLLDVLPNDFNRRTAAASSEIAWRPQGPAPQFLLNASVVLFSDKKTGYAFQAINQFRYCHLRRVVHQQVNVIVLSIEFHQLRFKVGAYIGEDFLKVVQNGFCEYTTAVFSHKDQMNVHLKNTVSTVPNVIVIAHRPEYD